MKRAPAARGGQDAGITQPRDHPVVQPRGDPIVLVWLNERRCCNASIHSSPSVSNWAAKMRLFACRSGANNCRGSEESGPVIVGWEGTKFNGGGAISCNPLP